MDGLFISILLSNAFFRKMHFYAKRKHVTQGFLSWLARNCNVIVVEVGRDVQASLHMMAQALQEGGSLLIFPEGTRSADGELGDFKSTFAALALEMKVPVVPIAISGAYRALPRGKRIPRPLTRIFVRFLPTITSDPAQDEDQLAETVRELIARNLQ
jgi:long-chain acyl-CoA synthetase